MAISHAMRKFHDIEQVLVKFQKKQITAEDFGLYLNAAGTMAKFLSVEIAAEKLACSGGKALQRMKAAGNISTASIPVTNEVVEMIPCSDRGDSMITHENCLDYSGIAKNIDRCQGCSFFTESRKRLANQAD